MTLKLAYLNKKKPIEKSKYEPNYKQEAKLAWEKHKAETEPENRVDEEKYRAVYEKHLRKFYE